MRPPTLCGFPAEPASASGRMPGPSCRLNLLPTILPPGREKTVRAVALDAPAFRIVLCSATRTGVRPMSSRESKAARIFLEAVEDHEGSQQAAFIREAAAGD